MTDQSDFAQSCTADEWQRTEKTPSFLTPALLGLTTVLGHRVLLSQQSELCCITLYLWQTSSWYTEDS